MALFKRAHTIVGSTTRIEAYSDAVIAIVITILVLEIHPPVLTDLSLSGVLTGMKEVWPHLAAFAFSFLNISVFWVNHHHFFHEIDRSDARLMWLNNALLFFLSLVPFTTAFLGHYPAVPGVVVTYCAVLFCAALAFSAMTKHALSSSTLITHDISDVEKYTHTIRNLVGTMLYALAAVTAPWMIWVSYACMLFVPIFYITPRLLHEHVHHE